jgi:sulfite oxidase
VYDILDQYLIGKLDSRDLVNGQVPSDEVDDPFANDPKRDSRLHFHTERPCNAETPCCDLATYITPNETFYVRNHLWVPNTDADSHRLTVELVDGTEKEYTIEDLKAKFPEVKVTATLQCSGNRRKHMTQESRSTNGLQWDVGAIGNAEWTGVRLRDVLADAGFPVNEVPEDTKHAQFVGAEAYGASIPIEKAVDKRGDVLLAYGMNGQPLPADHGFPLRVLVPGNVAARSVKWVNKIMISDEESTSQWQRRDYKCFGPNEGTNPDWDSARAIQEMPVQSAITSVQEISTHSAEDQKLVRVYGLEEEFIVVEGYAFSGGGRDIIRVDVSADDGRTWRQAELLPGVQKGSKSWAWTRWRFALPKRQAGRWLVVKAVDESYNTQPDSYEPQYNFRGNLTTAWHRVRYNKNRGTD